MLKSNAQLLAKVNSNADFIKAVSAQLQAEGKDEKAYNFDAACEVKAAQLKLETKANEVIHTTNTGYGAELVPGAVQTTDFLDLTPTISPILSAFRGFHGRNLNKIQEVPVIGRLAKHQLSTEWTTGSPVSMITQGKSLLPTAKITLTQKKYLFSVDISDEEMRFVNVLDIVTKTNEKLARSSAETIEALALNGDTTNASTGNINSDDGDPADTNYYLGANGLRKAAFAGSGCTHDVGTLDFDDFLTMLNVLGQYAAKPEDLLFIMNRATYNKSLAINELKQFLYNGKSSTIFSGSITNILGSDVFVSSEFNKTEADGKISVTPGNNTKGGLILAHRDAIQYGYNGEYQLEVFRVPGFGWQVLGYYYMGLSTANQLAGETDATVCLGYNVTL
jgi:HK97 family phage major capsid protein